MSDAARLPFERVTDNDENAYDAKALHRLGPKYCKANLVLPLRREGQRLIMGTASPDDVFVLDDVKRQLGISSVKHVLVPASDIRLVLEALMEEDDTDYDVDEILVDVEEEDVEVVNDKAANDEPDEADSSPIVRFVNHIIQGASKEGASDNQQTFDWWVLGVSLALLLIGEVVEFIAGVQGGKEGRQQHPWHGRCADRGHRGSLRLHPGPLRHPHLRRAGGRGVGNVRRRNHRGADHPADHPQGIDEARVTEATI